MQTSAMANRGASHHSALKRTAAIFVDDGGPDAADFENNFVWFDPSDPKDEQRAWLEARNLHAVRRRQIDPSGPFGDLREPYLRSRGPFGSAA